MFGEVLDRWSSDALWDTGTCLFLYFDDTVLRFSFSLSLAVE